MTSIPRPSIDIVQGIANNQVAIVTGAARGIGFATASLLAKKWSTSEPVSPRVNHDRADQPASLQCSGQSRDRVRHNYLADEKEPKTDTLQRPPTTIFDINLNSVVFGLKLGIHYMKPHGGRIVVVVSAGAYLPIPSQPLYSASKHAVLGLVRSTALMDEVPRSGISISWVAPWLTLTSMVEGLEATTNPDNLKSSPEDVAWAILAAAAAEAPNGKGYWVQGTAISEVEGAYGEVAGRLISPENRF
ncbi:hypothetical protein N7508_001043 [Penicillium antarcticum]|uniref:uncharacterized protein n=1 Tax=Penicillium antarcticum TaxID=416450 RepID=UPI00238959B6|nr:uncharacterized protein N7508_001043 [Penicillium antarcticum]KAJ5316535.1 hypothetical protein N7508_001043 [Penicillium antarcticum]